jgi:general secretion pathway protein D
MLGACAASPQTHPAKESTPQVDVQHTPPETSEPLDDDASKETRKPVVMRGTGASFRTPSPAKPHSQAPVETDGFQLNFVDTEISAVVAAVIGDGLGLPYLVDPQVKGTMSLQAARPLSRAEILPALEAALRLQGVALIAADGGYTVVPLKDAPRQVAGLRPPTQHGPGFGIQIVPLQFVGAADMEKVLKPLAPEGAILRVDESRNLLLLAGSSQELATLTGVVQTFDVDWLEGMSFAIYPLEYAEPRALADELAQVFADQKSPMATLVRFVPLARLNSLVVVTPQAQYLKKVETWIKQLDIGATTPGRRVYVFDVQNGKASDLAESLSQILSLQYERSETRSASAGVDTSQHSGLGGGGRMLDSGSPRGGYPAQRNDTRTAEGGATGSGGMKIVPNEESNSLLIFATPDEFALIEKALRRLDVEPIQVLIEASLAEVTLNDELRFGLQWAYQSGSGPVILSEATNGAIASKFPGLSYLYTGSRNIQAVLNSLESMTDVNVISSPKLLVLNNHEAQLQVGDQVPIATQSAVSAIGDNSPIVNSVELRDTGVILRVTPRVNKNGLVLLDIAQEVSDVVPTTTSSIDSPTIQQRKFSSSVAVHDGETIALGGLIRDSRSKSRSGLPLLSRIPVVGALFGSVDRTRTRTELIVLLTPRVIRSGKEASAMMDELHEEFHALHETLTQWQAAPHSNAHP